VPVILTCNQAVRNHTNPSNETFLGRHCFIIGMGFHFSSLNVFPLCEGRKHEHIISRQYIENITSHNQHKCKWFKGKQCLLLECSTESLTGFVCRKQGGIYWFHTRGTSKRSHHPIVYTVFMVRMHTW